MSSVRRLVPAAAVVCLMSLAVCLVDAPSVAHAAPAGASTYVPVTPYRILDTRTGQGFSRRLNGAERFSLALTNVPAGATAVVLNATITGPAGPGFVTIWPTGVAQPTASSINADVPGQAIANLVTVPVGSGGRVDVFSQMATDLVADVEGYYVPAATAQAGRFVPVNPTRLLDTRQSSSTHPGALRAGEAINLDVAGLGGLPGDATAAALKVTVTDSAASGYWTIYPAGATAPTASNLNTNGAADTIANQVIVRLSGGRISVYSQTGGQVVVDLVGWFTGTSSGTSDVGLFVPVTPARLLDSRIAPLGAMPGPNRTAEVPVANRFGVPASGVEAVVVNATVTNAVGAGYFSIWPARTYLPTASSLNATHAGQTIANHVIAPVSTAGFAFYTQTGAHLLADIAGWYTGTEVAAVLPPHVPLTGPNGPSGSSAFAFTRVTQSTPLRWNPCQAVPYVVNLGGYGESYRPVITEAVERLEAATGIPFVPAGDTTFVPTNANPMSSSPADGAMVIALSDDAHTDMVAGSIVGKTYISFSSVILKASVVIDLGDVGGRPEWSSTAMGPVLLHELGHAVGLGHIGDPTQIMNAVTTPGGPVTYAAGDLVGLWQVGAARGCA